MSNYKEAHIRELEIVQNIIDRMTRNSFFIKGWTITLVTVSLLIESQEIHKIIAFLPWAIFWALDAYFLRLERCYRTLYEWLINTRPENEELMFDLNAEKRFEDQVKGILSTMFSKTLFSFYIVVFILLLIINLYIIYR